MSVKVILKVEVVKSFVWSVKSKEKGQTVGGRQTARVLDAHPQKQSKASH